MPSDAGSGAIVIDLALRDSAWVFARDKQETLAGPHREAMRRRLLAFVEAYDRATAEADAVEFVARPSEGAPESARLR